MYSIHLQTGEVIRFDGIVVAPAQSVTDTNYIQYVDWVAAGNQPTVVETEENNE